MMVWEKGRITPMVLWSWFIIVFVIALVPAMCVVGFARWIGLIVDERQELLRGLGIALLDGRQDPCHVVHG